MIDSLNVTPHCQTDSNPKTRNLQRDHVKMFPFDFLQNVTGGEVRLSRCSLNYIFVDTVRERVVP